jgi:hypothetical protein
MRHLEACNTSSSESEKELALWGQGQLWKYAGLIGGGYASKIAIIRKAVTAMQV